jgi:hypothetical protein
MKDTTVPAYEREANPCDVRAPGFFMVDMTAPLHCSNFGLHNPYFNCFGWLQDDKEWPTLKWSGPNSNCIGPRSDCSSSPSLVSRSDR